VPSVNGFDGTREVWHDATVDVPKLTIRLRDERLYGLLKLLAGQRGVSMNRLIEEALTRELELEAALTQERLEETLALLKSYRADPDRLARQFAEAEVTEADPLRSEPAVDWSGTDAEDPLGALSGFSRAA
jgi:hypothetical protein